MQRAKYNRYVITDPPRFQDHRHRPLGHPSRLRKRTSSCACFGVAGPASKTALNSPVTRELRAPSMSRRLSRWLDAEIAERAGHAVHPQADVTFSTPQPIDHQAGLRAAVDRDADFLLR